MERRANSIFNEYFAELEARRVRVQRGWLLAKQTTWFALLTGGYLVLYLLDLMNQSFELLGIGF